MDLAFAVTTLFSLVGMVAVVKVGLDLVKYVKAQDWNGALTIAAAGALGVATAFLFQASDLGGNLELLPGETLSSLDSATTVIFGVAIGWIASFGTDWLKSRDNEDTAAKPPLLGD